MSIRTPRRVTARTPQQITDQLRQLARNWADERPDGVCDVLLEELTAVRPDLKETHP